MPESNIKIHRYRVQRGFTLIEAMIAMLIFAIGILGAYTLQIHATQGNTLANRVSTSTNWAVFAVEEIVGKDYGHSWLDDDQPDGAAGLDDTEGDADGAIYILPSGDKELDLSKLDPGDPDYNAAYNAPANALYSVYWNVAEGGTPGTADEEPSLLRDVKHIRVRVFRNGGIGIGNLYNHDYYRAKWPD